jgi:lysophospholipid acyltransferase (LPLAT)-like uncharacterized protein
VGVEVPAGDTGRPSRALDQRAPHSRLRRVRRRITRSGWFLDGVAFVAAAFIALYARTLRVRYSSHPEVEKLDRDRVLYGFWHGRQFLLVAGFRHSGIVVLTSVSWAGEIQARVLRRLGYVPVRGSSRRGAARGLYNMKKMLEEGRPAAFALDGPSGPLHRSKPGILFLARKLGRPIVPVAATAQTAWIVRSTWCRYLLPLPFARCSVSFGRPLWEALDESFTTADLDHVMTEWTGEADRAVGRRLDD